MNRGILLEIFSKETFIKITNQLINHEFTKDSRQITKPKSSKYIKNIENLGRYRDLGLQVLVISHDSKNDPRVGLSRELFQILKNYSIENALVATYTNSNTWRYTLLTTDLSINKSGRVVREFSNPKRHSFLLGPNSKVGTPYKYLVQKGPVVDCADLKSRFSIEVVNNDFYREIARLYDELVGVDKKPAKLQYPPEDNQAHEFAVRLIGRIIFCWFLKEKVSPSGTPLIPKQLLSLEAAGTRDYYNSVLAPLFFQVLNKPHQNRSDLYSSPQFNKIPYLNGGLFNPDNIDHYKFDKVTQKTVPNKISIPDSWLKDLLGILEEYNFTIDENTSFDTDISIDPEMLGRVFENLLARIDPITEETVRKVTGSFYTPREIVEYMVDESLTQYLTRCTDISELKIRALVSFDLTDDREHPLDSKEKTDVVKILGDLRILDPACGSGAFPIGILQKIVFILQQVDPEGRLWFEEQVSSITPELRSHIDREFRSKNFDYLRKLGIIRKSIYGVDIQPIATEISRLRCFLTLVVEQTVEDTNENRGIEPLPNLDFKFVTANSLLHLPGHSLSPRDNKQDLDLFDNQQKGKISELRELRESFFLSHGFERTEIREDFRRIQNELWTSMYRSKAYGQQSVMLTSWDPFGYGATEWFDAEWMFGVSDGFDIVIGNPPYIQLQKNSGKLRREYEKCGFKTLAASGDIYTLFYEKGAAMLNNDVGILCYITSNKWMRAGYGKRLREFFEDTLAPIQIVDVGPDVFPSATVDVSVLLLSKNKYSGKTRACTLDQQQNKNSLANLTEYVAEHSVDFVVPADGNQWTILSPIEKSIKQKIEKVGTPLKDWDINIYRGILTGYNKAFIIDNETKERLVTEDPKSAEILKPVLRGRDVKRYCHKWAGLWMIATHNGYGDTPPVEVDDYPYIKAHLDAHWDMVHSRRDQGNTPYNLRNCAYYEEFEVDKIIYQEIVQDTPAFYYDKLNYYVEASAFILTGDNLEYLTLFLNSSFAHYCFKTFYAGGGLGSKGVRYKKTLFPKHGCALT